MSLFKLGLKFHVLPVIVVVLLFEWQLLLVRVTY